MQRKGYGNTPIIKVSKNRKGRARKTGRLRKKSWNQMEMRENGRRIGLRKKKLDSELVC